jgi:hypothetical protein
MGRPVNFSSTPEFCASLGREGTIANQHAIAQVYYPGIADRCGALILNRRVYTV